MTHASTYRRLRLILGDQLNPRHSWLKDRDPDTLYLIAEIRQETDYVRHHLQKVCAFFAAMGNFANALEQAGHAVAYLTLDDTAPFENLPHLLESLIRKYRVTTFEYQLPDEWRVRNQLQSHQWPDHLNVSAASTEHYFLPDDELAQWVKADQHNRMETFYRGMRKRFSILMENGQPWGNRWNFDEDNRQSFSQEDIPRIPPPHLFENDVSSILERLRRHQVSTMGECDDTLYWPTTRRQSLALLRHFCEQGLPHFGQFQDAMTDQSEHGWSLYHSRLSFSLNSKMIAPREVMDYAIDAYEHSDAIDLAQLEGFVRQILGWREYIRAVYQVNMPRYRERNQLLARRHLPEWFWSGETRMNCQKQVISQSLQKGYAHHIQRLMITGNFCLLAGVHPDQVDSWYLGIYVDALEWVEMPNTRGMSQFADGGLVATKPYAASANYVNKMSDYCKSCDYNPRNRVGEDACPLNSMYWGFLHQHRKKLSDNQRLGMVYGNWDRLADEKKQDILKRRQWCLDHLEEL